MSLRAYSLNELPPVTKGLAAGALLGWVLEMAFSGPVNYYLGLVPLLVVRSGWLWQPLTYIFIHANFWHFLFNAFMLWMLGAVIEPVLGSRRFLIYFLFCGVVAGLFTVLASPGSAKAVIGASGAVYGLLYAFAALYPGQTVYVYFLFPMTARQFVIFMAGLSLVLSFATPNSGIANFTHLSGLAAGWLWFKIIGYRTQDTGYGARASGLGVLRRILGVFQRPVVDREAETQNRVDAILEKISRKGEGALTAAERRELDEYARSKGGRA
jgi:membrane associated rhomboid family serine protease